ncbi:hypothetical protein HZB88_05445, partial [archaeon]|nr:hypothetical protein [archaeon]
FFRHSLDYKKQRLELEVFIAITNLFSDFANNKTDEKAFREQFQEDYRQAELTEIEQFISGLKDLEKGGLQNPHIFREQAESIIAKINKISSEFDIPDTLISNNAPSLSLIADLAASFYAKGYLANLERMVAGQREANNVLTELAEANKLEIEGLEQLLNTTESALDTSKTEYRELKKTHDSLKAVHLESIKPQLLSYPIPIITAVVNKIMHKSPELMFSDIENLYRKYGSYLFAGSLLIAFMAGALMSGALIGHCIGGK